MAAWPGLAFKMKILFLQNAFIENHSLMSLAAVLKSSGHEASVHIDYNRRQLAKFIRDYAPDLIGFSALNVNINWSLEAARQIKKEFGLPIIFGGAYPTLNPEIIEREEIDFVCRLEGEYALLELMEAMKNGLPAINIKNLWAKYDNKIFKNELRPLIANLNSLPLPDHSIYSGYQNMKASHSRHFMASRGCPYSCSYCVNYALKGLYSDKVNIVRLRSAENMLKEIKDTIRLSKVSTVVFDDDLFSFDYNWMKQLLPAYKKEISIPYICNVRAGYLNEEKVVLLKDSGCFRVTIGVETGNEGLRKRILKRNETNEQILRATALLRKHRLKFMANFMFGIPDETLEDSFETVELGIKIKTNYPWGSIFQPYSGTRLAEYAQEKGYLDKAKINELAPTFYKDSPLKMANIKEMVNLQKLFILAVKFPFLFPAVRFMARLPLRWLYEPVFLFTFGIRFALANRFGFRAILAYARRNLKFYFHNQQDKVNTNESSLNKASGIFV